LRDRALEAVLAIADALSAEGHSCGPHSASEADAASLADGDAGLAIFFAYLAQAGLTVRGFEPAERFLDAAQALLATAPMTPSLYQGFTGVAWATEHLTRRMFQSDDDNPNEAIDEALQDYLTQSPWVDDFDLVSGLVGVGVYALERLPRPSASVLLGLVIDRLRESAERTADGITWHTAPQLLSPSQRDRCPGGHHNLGVAHGVPGVIALLGRACAAGVARATAASLLDGAVAWLLAHQLPTGFGASFGWAVAPGIEGRPARSAWCYGDPGIAAALLVAAHGAGRGEWEREAIALAHQAVDRPVEQTRVRDAGLCHGAAGLAHIFNRLAQSTRDPRLADGARTWFAHALEMHRPGCGIGGFAARNVAQDGSESWAAERGLLTGAAGVGLALLAAITPIEPAWDRMLLMPALETRPGAGHVSSP